MKTLLSEAIYNILKEFYMNKNEPIHLRELARRIALNQSPLSKHLAELVTRGILVTQKDGNLKKFYVSTKYIPLVFSLFDFERFENLAEMRKKALKYFVKYLVNKPLFMIVFGSTAKGTNRDDSDIDVLIVSRVRDDYDSIVSKVFSQTSCTISVFFMDEKMFYQELKLKNDMVVQSALFSGFPFFNEKYFYEVLYE